MDFRRRYSRWLPYVALSIAMNACTILPKGVVDMDVGMKERGIASWYGYGFHGQLTANGEIYNMEAFTAAHRTLPLGTVVKVTNVENGKQIHVRINDRGPYLDGRILDLSYGSAKELVMVEGGTAAVQLEVVGRESLILLAVGRAMAALDVFGLMRRGWESADHLKGGDSNRRSIPKEACRWRGFSSVGRRPSPEIGRQLHEEETGCRTTDTHAAHLDDPLPLRHFHSVSLG